ncbi:ATP-binding protein [Streptomyces sp. NPDC127178]|uniref:ATP-binding protein n=1 Tax=unclassified Streptomyces TaxID=2593676 RepID=UPI00363342D9
MPETEPESELWEYSLYIPNDVRAVTVSRRTLRLILTMHGLISLVDVAELLATELVSNAVRHTKGPAALRVRWAAGVLRIGAWDRSARWRCSSSPSGLAGGRQASRCGAARSQGCRVGRAVPPLPSRVGGSGGPSGSVVLTGATADGR